MLLVCLWPLKFVLALSVHLDTGFTITAVTKLAAKCQDFYRLTLAMFWSALLRTNHSEFSFWAMRVSFRYRMCSTENRRNLPISTHRTVDIYSISFSISSETLLLVFFFHFLQCNFSKGYKNTKHNTVTNSPVKLLAAMLPFSLTTFKITHWDISFREPDIQTACRKLRNQLWS